MSVCITLTRDLGVIVGMDVQGDPFSEEQTTLLNEALALLHKAFPRPSSLHTQPEPAH